MLLLLFPFMGMCSAARAGDWLSFLVGRMNPGFNSASSALNGAPFKVKFVNLHFTNFSFGWNSKKL